MNKQQVGLLLALASGFDNRKPSDMQTAAWFEVLHQTDYEQAKRVVLAHYSGPNHAEYLTVGVVLEGVRGLNRANRNQVLVDVRAAKSRGLVARSWPASEPLDAGTAARLADLREADRVVAERWELEELSESVSDGYGILEG